MNKTSSINLMLATLLFAGAASAAVNDGQKQPAPAAAPAKTDGMSGMDHSNMQGKGAAVDHSKMAGMDHGKMTGMDHGKMAGMGKMSAAQHAVHFAKIDKNRDGFLTAAELPKDMRPHFAMMDINKDGKLTVAECAAMHKK